MCNAADGSHPVAVFLNEVRHFAARPSERMTAEELGEHLIQLRRGIDLLELTFARDAAVFASSDEYEAQGSVSPVDWVRHHCHMSRQAAGRSLNAGRHAELLPESVSALESGGIGFPHFALIAGVARARSARTDSVGSSPEGSDSEQPDASLDGESNSTVAFDERPLLALALEHSVGRFGFDCTHARHAIDAAAVLQEHVVSVEQRHLEFIPCEGGGVAMRVFLDPIGAAVVQTAVLPLAAPLGYGDQRELPRRLADALVEIANHALDLGVVPGKSGQRTHLQLTASVETVMGLEGAAGGDLEFAGPIPAATVQRLACDAIIRRVLLGPRSVVIDVGRARRLPTVSGRDALMAQSRGCAWPRCDRPTAYTNAHHIVHWAQGGETNLENLVLLCYSHHWRVHEGGWQLVKTEDGPFTRVLAIPPTPSYRSWIRPPAVAAVIG
ncbi:MAG TPA: DUF222 domain-containing protein [Candidatus Dormibacteraeota bacterium]